jgi:hypothetical protein
MFLRNADAITLLKYHVSKHNMLSYYNPVEYCLQQRKKKTNERLSPVQLFRPSAGP